MGANSQQLRERERACVRGHMRVRTESMAAPSLITASTSCSDGKKWIVAVGVQQREGADTGAAVERQVWLECGKRVTPAKNRCNVAVSAGSGWASCGERTIAPVVVVSLSRESTQNFAFAPRHSSELRTRETRH